MIPSIGVVIILRRGPGEATRLATRAFTFKDPRIAQDGPGASPQAPDCYAISRNGSASRVGHRDRGQGQPVRFHRDRLSKKSGTFALVRRQEVDGGGVEPLRPEPDRCPNGDCLGPRPDHLEDPVDLHAELVRLERPFVPADRQ